MLYFFPVFTLCLISFCFLSGNFVTETAPVHLYKILTVTEWEKTKSEPKLKLPSSDDDFIHLSEENQVNKTINKFYSKESDVVVLKLDVRKLKGGLVRETNPGGVQKYYHLYAGEIPKESIIEAKKTPVKKNE
jgi:uncharacterized protein (DUF952 family)